MSLLLALSLSLTLSGPGRAQTHVFFGPPESGAASLETHLVEYLETARSKLDACFFDLKSKEITRAFVAAAERGVRVRFVTDDDRYFDKGGRDDGKVRDTIRRLLDAGIPVVHDDRSGLMHNKFCVKDDRSTWTGSYNVTDEGARDNLNNALWVESAELTAIYTAKFEEMFEEKQFGGSSPTRARREQRVEIDGRLHEVYFAPEDRPTERIVELIDGARESVYFMQYAFTSDAVGDALIRKKEEGLEIAGLFDHLLYRSTGPYSEFSRLTAREIPVMVLRPPRGILHHKVFILDPGTEHGIVITGSLNASDGGNSTNDENVLFIHDPEIARAYFEEYQRLSVGTTGNAVAGLIHADSPRAGAFLPDLLLHICSNGIDLDAIEIELPARWKFGRDVLNSFWVTRGTTPITDRVRIDLRGQKLVLENVGVTAIGEDSNLLIEMSDLDTPRIPGIYSFVVKVGTDPGSLRPLDMQPTIKVVEQGRASAIRLATTPAASFSPEPGPGSSGPGPGDLGVSDLGLRLGRVTHHVRQGRYEGLEDLLARAENGPWALGAPGSSRFRSTLVGGLQRFSRLVNQQALEGRDQARRLAPRIRDLLDQSRSGAGR